MLSDHTQQVKIINTTDHSLDITLKIGKNKYFTERVIYSTKLV